MRQTMRRIISGKTWGGEYMYCDGLAGYLAYSSGSRIKEMCGTDRNMPRRFEWERREQ